MIPRPTAACLFATLAACTAQGPVSRPATESDILVSVPSPEQRRLWQTAFETGAVPPVSEIEVPDEPVGTIPQATVAEVAEPRTPTLPEGVAVAVAPVVLPAVTGFVGRARVVEVTPDRLRLLLENGEPLEIAYRAPSRSGIGALRADRRATVEIAPVEPGGPVNAYAVAVSAERGPVALIAMQETGIQPIERSYRTADATIRQILQSGELRRMVRDPAGIPPGGAPVPVEVSISGRSVVLQPGEIAGPDRTGMPYEVVVFESRMYPPEAARSDTPPFALNVAVFAADVR